MNRHHSTLCMCESTHYFNGRGNIIIFQFLDEVVEPSKNLKLITRTFEVALTVLTAELSALTASGGQLTQARDGVTADGI